MENITKSELTELLNSFVEEIKKELKNPNLITDTELIKTQKKAAKIADCSAQDIKKMIDEGRLINYGRGNRDYRFRRSELLDLRKVRNEKD